MASPETRPTIASLPGWWRTSSSILPSMSDTAAAFTLKGAGAVLTPAGCAAACDAARPGCLGFWLSPTKCRGLTDLGGVKGAGTQAEIACYTRVSG